MGVNGIWACLEKSTPDLNQFLHLLNDCPKQISEWCRHLVLNSFPSQSPIMTESIIRWLLGEDLERFNTRSPNQLDIAKQAMDYRWRILQQRYLGVRPERAYRHLTARLGSIIVLRNKIRTWVALSRDRQRAVVDVLQEVLQELLHSDRYMQQQIAWISRCTKNARLKEALLLTSLEEYCLRPNTDDPELFETTKRREKDRISLRGTGTIR